MKIVVVLACAEICLGMGAQLVRVELSSLNPDPSPICLCREGSEKFYLSAFEETYSEYDSGCDLYSYETDNRGSE